jgi:hypothetical protein
MMSLYREDNESIRFASSLKLHFISVGENGGPEESAGYSGLKERTRRLA